MYIYLLQSGESDCFKIGISEDIALRIRDLQPGNPHPIRLIASSNTDRDILSKHSAYIVERTLHRIFDDVRMRGEWFRLGFEEVTLIKITYQTLEKGTVKEIDSLRGLWLPMTNKHNLRV